MSTIAQNLETLDTAISTMKTNLNLSSDASLSDVVTATAGGGGGEPDWSEYFYQYVFGGNSGTNNFTNWAVKKFPKNFLEIASNITSLQYAFGDMRSLVTAPELDTSNIKYFKYMFSNCNNLENVPVYDASGAQENQASMEYMFSSTKLTDQSLDNILQMCISAPQNMSGRNLARLGFSSSAYPVARIQSLPHYQQFISANWSIGY